MTLTETLLSLADTYAARAVLSRSRVSTLIFNDGKALDRVASGGDLNTRSFEKAMRWFAENWPTGAEWPEGVDRPAPVVSTPPVANASEAAA